MAAFYLYHGRKYQVACGDNAFAIERLLAEADAALEDGREQLSRTLKLAVDAMKRYPLPIATVEDAIQLQGVGKYLANRIAYHVSARHRLPPHEQQQRARSPPQRRRGLPAAAGGADAGPPALAQEPVAGERAESEADERAAASRPVRPYTPMYDTPAFHLLVALSIRSSSTPFPSRPSLPRASLFSSCVSEHAQFNDRKLSDALRKLSGGGLVLVYADADAVALTERGAEQGLRLHRKWIEREEAEDAAASSSSPSPAAALLLGSRHPLSAFTVLLCIDSRERSFHSHSVLSRQLASATVMTSVRPLSIGDFCWVAQHTASGAEYVLDLIVERKRMSDLVHSVIDGRMREQRWRMKRTAFQRRVFLIEGDYEKTSTHYRHAIPQSTVDSVLSSLAVAHGYRVQRVDNVAGSVQFLKDLHRQLLRELADTGVEVREEWRAFDARMKKRGGEEGDEERRRTWGSQLRMIRGVSPVIAAAIVQRFPHARALVAAFEACEGLREEERLLSDLTFGAKSRRLGKQLSRRIRQVLRMPRYDAQAEEDEEREEKERIATARAAPQTSSDGGNDGGGDQRAASALPQRQPQPRRPRKRKPQPQGEPTVDSKGQKTRRRAKSAPAAHEEEKAPPESPPPGSAEDREAGLRAFLDAHDSGDEAREERWEADRDSVLAQALSSRKLTARDRAKAAGGSPPVPGINAMASSSTQYAKRADEVELLSDDGEEEEVKDGGWMAMYSRQDFWHHDYEVMKAVGEDEDEDGDVVVLDNGRTEEAIIDLT